MVNGITFSEQLITSENFAHFMYTFLNHANGVTKGCGISNANGKVYIQKGYFVVFGRMVQIVGTEEIPSPEVISGQVYCKVVFEIDLSKENTAEEFIQGAFKVLTSTAGYPSVRQEDLDDGGKVYQMPWCQYIKQAGAIKDFRDLREVLDLNSIWNAISNQNTQYKGEFDDYFAAQRATILGMIAELEGQGYATTAELNGLSAEVAEAKKSVSDGKAEIAAAITLKRVVTAATAPFHTMAENIKQIRLGSGNAQPADVRQGKTFTNDEGIEYTGNMQEYASGTKGVSCGLNDGGLYYYMGAGYWRPDSTGKSWVYMSRDDVATAIGLNPDYMLDSLTVLGKKGNIQSMAGTTITPQTYKQTVWSAWKRLTGNVEIAAVPLPPASVIKKGYRYWIGGSYVDGTYVYSDITGYYYQAPNEMTGVTGGFVSHTETYGSMARPESVSYSKQTGYMEIETIPLSADKSYSVDGYFVTRNKIDVTKIRNIYLDIVHTGVTSYYGLATNASDIRNSVVVRESMSGTKTFSLDVSMMTGQYYLFLSASGQYGISSGSRGSRVRVSAIRYETMA